MKACFSLCLISLLSTTVFAQRAKDPTTIPDPDIKVSAGVDAGGRRTVEVLSDWVIKENKTSSHTLFKVHGNIYLMPGITWAMTDCEVVIMCEHARQYRMYWQKGSTLKTTRCRLGGYADENRFAPANFEAKGGTWIATDTEVHSCYAVSVGDGTVFRGNRFVAGKRPDSIIISGNADVVLKDSNFPLSISMHCSKGGVAELDLPCKVPMNQVLDAGTLLNGAGKYKIVFENTIVPHWFIFARDISSDPSFPKATVTIKRCQNFLMSILTKNVTGEVRLPVNFEHPITVGNTTIQRAPGATQEDVNMRMFGGVYFGGNPDAVVVGPKDLVNGKPVHIAETMMWGGKLCIDGGTNKTILLNCTTMDVWKGDLVLENLHLGTRHGTGQMIVEQDGTIVSRDCDFGPNLFVLTKDQGTVTFHDYKPGKKIRIDTQGGDVQFLNPRP